MIKSCRTFWTFTGLPVSKPFSRCLFQHTLRLYQSIQKHFVCLLWGLSSVSMLKKDLVFPAQDCVKPYSICECLILLHTEHMCVPGVRGLCMCISVVCVSFIYLYIECTGVATAAYPKKSSFPVEGEPQHCQGIALVVGGGCEHSTV